MTNSFYTIPTNKNDIQPTSYDAPRQPEAFPATFVERGSYTIAQTPTQRAYRTRQAPIDSARGAVNEVYASQIPQTPTEVRLSPEQASTYVNYVGQIGRIKATFIAKETGSLT